MANGYREKEEAAQDLITQIKIMKLALEGKYGPPIKKKWAKRKVYDDELAIPT